MSEENQTNNQNKQQIVTIMGLPNCEKFNQQLIELKKIKFYLENNDKKQIKMVLKTIVCSQFQFEERVKQLKKNWDINQQNPVIFTLQTIHQSFEDFQAVFVNESLKITFTPQEYQKFWDKQKEKSKVAAELLNASVESSAFFQIKNHLNEIDNNYVYVKLFEEDKRLVFSLLLELNRKQCPKFTQLFSSLMGRGLIYPQKDENSSQKPKKKIVNFKNQSKSIFFDDYFSWESVQVSQIPEVQGHWYQQEVNNVKHSQKGNISLNIQKNKYAYLEKIGFDFTFGLKPDFDASQNQACIGSILYGYNTLEDLNSQMQANQKKSVYQCLHIVESENYKFNQEDFVLLNGFYTFRPNAQKDREYINNRLSYHMQNNSSTLVDSSLENPDFSGGNGQKQTIMDNLEETKEVEEGNFQRDMTHTDLFIDGNQIKQLFNPDDFEDSEAIRGYKIATVQSHYSLAQDFEFRFIIKKQEQGKVDLMFGLGDCQKIEQLKNSEDKNKNLVILNKNFAVSHHGFYMISKYGKLNSIRPFFQQNNESISKDALVHRKSASKQKTTLRKSLFGSQMNLPQSGAGSVNMLGDDMEQPENINPNPKPRVSIGSMNMIMNQSIGGNFTLVENQDRDQGISRLAPGQGVKVAYSTEQKEISINIFDEKNCLVGDVQTIDVFAEQQLMGWQPVIFFQCETLGDLVIEFKP